ncbi:MAG: cell surface protein SprA, partial [Bacteroidia bacterium]|nr:cell surface protein SprA [Bacteroidia bacterium]
MCTTRPGFPDGKRSFENGLSTSLTDTTLITKTVWGKVSGKTSTAYAFDNTPGVRDAQDVGLDGLSTQEEATWPSTANYLDNIRNKLDPNALNRMQEDPFSPLNDPGGDNYHYFRGSDFDAQKAGILQRYNYSTAETTLPNVEDINLDFTLNETERYYQYHVSIRPQDMVVGQNFINDKRTSTVVLKNDTNTTINWYQFKVPIRDGVRIGNINGFNSIRFIRMFLTGFQDSTILRLASLDLVRGDWRNYTKDLYNVAPITDAKVDVSTVSLEENSGRTPINYKLPPGVTQESDPSQPGVYLEDEQSLAFRITDLSPGDARSVYKNTAFDFRQYERIQMFVHAESFVEDLNPPKDYEMTVFMRLGTDYQNNYYEYEIPLQISPAYVNTATSIWPDNNFFDIPFKLLTDLKTKRNMTSGALTKEFAEYDAENIQNKVKIMGNPSLADVKTIMVGVRNKGTTVKSVEIWMNELRLSGFQEKGGWAALGSAVLALSDLGTINASGRFVSDGFGGLEQSVSERSITNYGQYNMALSFNMGRFFPEKAKVNFPLYYSVSNEQSTPKYDPLNEDLLLKDVLAAAPSKAIRDSILNYSQKLKTYKSLSLTGVRIGLKNKIPLPIDPDNFTFRYTTTESFERDATTEYEITQHFEGGASYNYASPFKSWTPFAKSKKLDSPWLKFIKEFNLNVLPNSITANTNLIRDYFEKQARDLASGSSGMDIPLTVSKNFMWNTDLDLNWNLTKNLRMKFTTNNRSVVEETLNSPVNKELFATEYENWKDTVSQSLRNFGTPLNYTQTTNLNWQIPMNRIPVVDFLTASSQYNAVYNWDRSAISSTQTDVGNVISNDRTLTFTTTANLTNLYNKWDFLKSVNKKFDTPPKPKLPVPAKRDPNKTADPTKPTTAGNDGKVDLKTPAVDSKQKAPVALPVKPIVKEPKKFEKELDLVSDSLLPIKHNLKNKRVY